MKEFRTIPDWPAYAISSDGVVMRGNKTIKINSHDCVNLTMGNRRANLSVAQLLHAVWGKKRKPAQAAPGAEDNELKAAQNEVASLKQKIVALERRAVYQRKLNATFWSRLRNLEADLERAPSRARALVHDERKEWEAMQADFDGLNFEA